MVFYPPSWVPKLPYDPPDTITIGGFMRSELYGRRPLAQSRNPFTCGLTGKTRSTTEMFHRSDSIARALCRLLGLGRDDGATPWDKVVGVFALNSIDYLSVLYAVNRLDGIAAFSNASSTADELVHQLRTAGAKALFTCVPILDKALEAAGRVGIADDKIFLLDVPGFAAPSRPQPLKTVDDLVELGDSIPAASLAELRWPNGQGARQTAVLCFSSGTTGLPKAVKISHRNMIANVMQYAAFDSVGRAAAGITTQAAIGVLPFCHIFGLVAIALAMTRQGDEVIVLPRFDYDEFLRAVERFGVSMLPLVPPIVVGMLSRRDMLKHYDLSSVRFVHTGAAPLGKETIRQVLELFPTWEIGQGYGLTETATVVCATSHHDVMMGTSGSLLPGFKAKLVDAESGTEITGLDTAAELWVCSPSVTLGYLNDEKATAAAFVWDGTDSARDRWMRTGDMVMMVKSDNGYEHVVVVDRLKELIKVKANQVAPAELEAHLLGHPMVDDAAVVGSPDEAAGEVPKAFVVKAPTSKSDAEVRDEIVCSVQDHKAKYKWLEGGVEFLDAIPKSPSGKILRRLLRERERARRRQEGGRL